MTCRHRSCILRKDLLVLRRSPAARSRVLIAYPLVIAAADRPDGGVREHEAAGRARRPRADPARDRHRGRKLRRRRADRPGREERRDRAHVARAGVSSSSQSGRVAAVDHASRAGFVAELKGLVTSPHLTLATGTGGITPPRPTADAGARLQPQPEAAERLHPGGHRVRRTCSCTAAAGASSAASSRSSGSTGPRGCSSSSRRSPEVRARSRTSSRTPRLALALTDNAIRATASPIVLDEVTGRGRTSALSAQVQAYGLAITIAFLGVLLAAGALAAERDENAIGRLVRGLVGLGELVMAKIALAVDGRARRWAWRYCSRSGSRSRLADVRGGAAVAAAAARTARRWCSPAPRSARSERCSAALARESRTASLVGDPGRPAGRLPRARAARDRPRRRVDQRRVSRSCTRSASSPPRSTTARRGALVGRRRPGSWARRPCSACSRARLAA